MFAEQTPDPNSGSLPAKVTGKVARFLARQVRSKRLALRDTPPMVSFTFDDVPVSACEIGAQILERHGARGTFYVTGAGCGTAGPGGPLRATIEQLQTLWQKGHEIGCHTYSHPAVPRVTLDELGADLDRNQAVLKTINRDIRVRNFAYPYGDLSVRSKRYLESRFDSCRTSHPGINRRVADLGALDAWPLENASIDRAKIDELIAETVRSPGWLIFCSHDVAEQPNHYGVTPDLLEWAVVTAKRSGCALTTMSGSLKRVSGHASEE
jgi:peptidoglycan/xylan/chitin deacetylase (PgdA/CDA1 family)